MRSVKPAPCLTAVLAVALCAAVTFDSNTGFVAVVHNDVGNVTLVLAHPPASTVGRSVPIVSIGGTGNGLNPISCTARADTAPPGTITVRTFCPDGTPYDMKFQIVVGYGAP